MDILVAVVIAILLVPAMILTSGVLRVGLALAVVLVVPGYALLAAILPRRAHLGGAERLALSLGASVAMVAVSGFVLNYTGFGIAPYSIAVPLLILTVIFSAVAVLRRSRVPADDRYQPSVVSFFRASQRWSQGRRLDRVLFVSLAVMVLFTSGVAWHLASKPKGEPFTEFFLLGSYGKAADYPGRVLIGGQTSLGVGVINHERKTTTYRVEPRLDGQGIGVARTVTLVDGERWESAVEFTPQIEAAHAKLELLLFRDGESDPAHILYLWLTVSGF